VQQKEKILQQEKEKLKDRMPGKFDKWLTPRFTDAQVASRPISDMLRVGRVSVTTRRLSAGIDQLR
jgi:hypothetical protein